VIDAASFALMLGAASSNGASLLIAGGVAYLLGPPIAHVASGHPAHAAGSLGLRALGGGLATGIVLVDLLSHPCDGEPSCRHDPSTGLTLATLALLAAAAVDDAWLAREDIETHPEQTALRAGIALGPGRASLSIGARF